MRRSTPFVLGLVFIGCGLDGVAAPLLSVVPESGIANSTALVSLASFSRTGDFDEVFVNNTGKRIYDLQFGFTNLDGDAGGTNSSLFQSVQSARSGSSLQFQTMDFSYAGGGNGIAPGQQFRVTASGFGSIGAGGGASTLNVTPTVGGTSLLSGWDSGPSSNRVDLWFLGDGYRGADLAGAFRTHATSLLDYLFGSKTEAGQAPFRRYRNFFNVHMVDVISNQVGADKPWLKDPAGNPTGMVDTALNGCYLSVNTVTCAEYTGIELEDYRLLYVDQARADAVLDERLVDAALREMRVVTVNDSRYGGAGGAYAVYAGGNAQAREVAIHELGHAFGQLGDEYLEPGASQTYAGPEPAPVNLTADPTCAKWSVWQGTENVGCEAGGERFYTSGIYRPTPASRMSDSRLPFDPIGREALIHQIYTYVDPLDRYLDNTAVLRDPDTLWVDVVDPAVIDVAWFVDGILAGGARGESFDPDLLGLGEGDHVITARAFDTAITAGSDGPDWVRRDKDLLTQIVSWNIVVSGVPEPATVELLLVSLLGWVATRRSPARAA
ncbi:M64 family metallopeptidase [Zoogloea sp.]|uniref:M64 family metallopeptidase n=1 Tax=Zoogloea sp. TaxID=49181 RepID=UPI00260504EE|nr:M64 family metallopeptidase [Zoogloea sp.]MDD3354860.1 M64 family metallopeptidase [Zoogloea sp.]